MAPALAEALGSPLPVGTLPLKVFAAAYKGAAPNAAIALALEIDATKLDFVQKDGIYAEQLQVASAATDARGKVYPGERHTVNLALKPDTWQRATERGFRLITQTNLPPGRYQLRMAVSSKNGKAGSVLYDLEVPDFYKGPFVMSGVTLTAVSAGLAPTMKVKDPLADFLPGPPTATREFDAGDTLMFFVEFYENAGNGPAHMVDLKAELRGENGRVVLEAAEQRSSTEVKGSGGYGFAGRLPLSDLAPGLYVLHVEGRVRSGDNPTASRDIQIRIR